MEGDRGKSMVLRMDGKMLIGLERMVKELRIEKERNNEEGELIDDENIVIEEDIVIVEMEKIVGEKRVVEVMKEREVLDVVKDLKIEVERRIKKIIEILSKKLGEDRGIMIIIELIILLR